jgi:uncharacterized Zn-binding protein involved in type VI secretion
MPERVGITLLRMRTVDISGAPAARRGDKTAHGGTIVGGFESVQIG